LVLSTFSTSSEAFKDLLEKSRHNSEDQDKGMSKIYIMGNWRWMVAVSKPARSFNSVVLDGDLSTKIYSDALQFFESKNWYYQNGVPYRRVTLLLY
jgi:mitochondrial chaperone BCS1